MRVALLHLRNERPTARTFNDTLTTLNDATLETIAALGWQVETVASGEHPVQASLDAVDRADVVVLMGGEDVDPAQYGGPADYPESGFHDPASDAAHIAVVRHVAETGTPLLGICRGLQVINVALGGTLVQHIETDMHRTAGKRGLESFTSQSVAVSDERLNADVATSDVYCGHHQAIDVLGAGLTVAARAHDDTVEAVVHETAPITGVQWHPEFPAVAAAQLTPLLQRLERQVSERR